MAEGINDDRYAMMVCPFDESHFIEVFIAAKHIMKCKKNFPNHKKTVCPFNAIHWVEKSDYRDHIRSCPDRGRIEADIKYEHEIAEKQAQFGYLNETSLNREEFVLPDSEENWEEEAVYVTKHLTVSHKDKVQRGAHFKAKREEYFPERNYPQPVQEPQFRRPKGVPQVLQQQQTPPREPQEKKLPSSRLENVEALKALSLGRGVGRGVLLTSQSGRGRGRGVMVMTNEKPPIPNGLQEKVNTMNEGPPPGLGRGRGRCKYSVNGATKLPSGNQLDDSAYGSTSDSETAAETEKLQKKLTKKLREINSLEAKQREGKVLNPDQLKKLALKSELEIQLKNCALKKCL